MKARVALLLALAVAGSAVAGCAAPTPTPEPTLRYAALGDSYTIGTSVAEADRWPNQLVARLGPVPPTLELVGNLGVNGATSTDLIVDQLDQLNALEPDFVTLQIGVNDVVQGVAEAEYELNAAFIVETLAESFGSDRVLCVATPDYTVTPVGQIGAFGPPAEQRAGIEQVNAWLEATCDRLGVRFVGDIFALSQAAADDESLVAGDGLHPSGAQYATWVDAILPVVEELIGR